MVSILLVGTDIGFLVPVNYFLVRNGFSVTQLTSRRLGLTFMEDLQEIVKHGSPDFVVLGYDSAAVKGKVQETRTLLEFLTRWRFKGQVILYADIDTFAQIQLFYLWGADHFLEVERYADIIKCVSQTCECQSVVKVNKPRILAAI